MCAEVHDCILVYHARIQKCGLGEVECQAPMGGGFWDAPRQKNYGMLSFKMVHFDALWSTF